jgi:protein-tyrosine sulfotransferase
LVIVLLYAFLITYFDFQKLEASVKTCKNNDRNDKPIIFIGGSPRSGTTLMRVMLDTHRDISCGDETKILPVFLMLAKKAETHTSLQKEILQKNGMTNDIINTASKAFIYNILEGHSNFTPILCAKDPTILSSTTYLSDILPTSKFIFMIRDARPVVLSIVKRAVSLAGFSSDLENNLRIWNELVEDMYRQCEYVGKERCLPVYYEQLVLHPEKETRNIYKFLNLEWTDAVLHHEDYFHKKIHLSDLAKSADQVIKPVNIESLYDWIDNIPQNILDNIDSIAPMLKVLGYDTKSKRPDYGKPDQKILDNTLLIKANPEKWNELKKNHSFYFRNKKLNKIN